MACESMVGWDAGEFATTDDKIVRIGDELLGAAGHTDSIFKFIEWYRAKGERPEIDADKSFEVVVLNKSGIYLYVNSTYPMRLTERFYAAGTGGMAAKAAMLCGKSP